MVKKQKGYILTRKFCPLLANRYIKIDKTSRIFYIYEHNDKYKVISYHIDAKSYLLYRLVFIFKAYTLWIPEQEHDDVKPGIRIRPQIYLTGEQSVFYSHYPALQWRT